ncbi:MAG: Fe2+-dependent dioxygenase [SAR86 cluster bacterium]|uniref:Fe2+-dependent dioxygenase n=1 Tax=SAR86 cluster bacterium TaxID=2030880 RepID=A0A2A5AEA9_9GAMM|nr:MAG: Fe2+-dependent dioxygenase [SAR86 cluster bacterium]
MYLRIPQLLNADTLKLVDELIATGNFKDGAETTGIPTKSVKKNVQLDLESHPQREEFLRQVTQAVNENPIIRSAAIPRRMTLPLVSKYGPGMSYGWHIDNALMFAMGNPVRSDLACTIFISNKKDYDGGDLMVRTASGDIRAKLERGDAFLYPATSRHQVTEVTSGERLAIVFWIQSMIADVGKREILHDLGVAYDLVTRQNPTSDALQAIQRAQANLVRRWSEV